MLEEEKGSCSFCSPQDAGLRTRGVLPQPRGAPTASGAPLPRHAQATCALP